MSEKGEIARDGAKAQKNSGRGQHQKGDATIGPFCYDIKEYPKGYSITDSGWAKVCTDALKSGDYVPAIKVVLGPETDKTRLWVIGDKMFAEMLVAWEEKYG